MRASSSTASREPSQQHDVDHRRFVDDDEVGGQRVVAVMHEVVARLAVPEEAVQGLALDRCEGEVGRVRVRQGPDAAAHGLGQLLGPRAPWARLFSFAPGRTPRRAMVRSRLMTMNVFPVPGSAGDEGRNCSARGSVTPSSCPAFRIAGAPFRRTGRSASTAFSAAASGAVLSGTRVVRARMPVSVAFSSRSAA